MTRVVRFRPEAEAEALEARQWYEERRPGLGDEFTEEISRIIGRIVGNPMQFPRVRGETRRAVLRRFPYALYFRLAGDDVLVLAVHGRQHPLRWQSR